MWYHGRDSSYSNAIIADYLYDPSLRQRQKAVSGVKTNYYYSGFQRLADYDGSAGTPGTLLNRYVYGTGMDDVLIQITAGGTKIYYHQNHQGSVIATTNSSGAVLNRYAYGPFGESAALTGTTHGYTGQRFDSETGLYYYKMRYYSPKLGRFLQPDPIGMAGGMNLYGYIGNSPLRATDSMGLDPLIGGVSAADIYDPFFSVRSLDTIYANRDATHSELSSLALSAVRSGVEELLNFSKILYSVSVYPFDGVVAYNTLYNFGVRIGDKYYTAAVGYYDPEGYSRKSDTSNKLTAKGEDLFGETLNVYNTMIWVPIHPGAPSRKIASLRNVQIGKYYGTTYWNTLDGDDNVVGSFETYTTGLFVSGFDYGNWGYQGNHSGPTAGGSGGGSGSGGSSAK